METKGPQSRLHEIAALTLESFKRLSREGIPIDVERLAASLQASEELKTLAGPATTAEKFMKNEMLRLKKELGTLQIQYKKIDAKRRELTGHLDRAEDINTQKDAFIQRAIPTLAGLARSGSGRQFPDLLDRITDLLKSKASFEQLEIAFQQLKDTVFRVEFKKEDEKPSSSKASAIFNLFKRQTPSEATDLVSHFRDTYSDIVEEFRLNLDQAALDELAEIKSRLSGMLQVEDFLPIRQKLLALLRDFISRISSERKQAATFIFEVGERLLEVERQMLRSITVTRESRNAKAQFTNTIEKEMDAFQETVNVTKSLEELKSSIMVRISSIKKVIENSRREDHTQNIQADNELTVLKKSLDLMKTEIKTAKNRSQALEAELLIDPLTNAFNRRAYDQRIVDELERFHRYRTIFSMLLLDVDHFKDINDRYGHAVGDLCLKEIINRIKPLLRKPDFLARFGGEEFVIVLPGTERDGSRKAAEKIRMHIEKTEFLHKGESVKVTISLGATQVQPSDKSAEKIFERVDKAMYQAKESGRNRVVVL